VIAVAHNVGDVQLAMDVHATADSQDFAHLTTGQSASPVLQGRVKRGNMTMESKPPQIVAEKPRL